ncbi:response regulator [Marinobacter halodurans]|uniref:Response regulator n=1 Tax=Marinobacter halodurans TaxID=2528979 RepID=A0ABY1ZJT2_9GAMM|nr:HDOD domain-containing protein [Marinobacter halodurans]TBW55472.1 response regulator [Marinobacter halodurans]
MGILILEDDLLVAELLETIALSLSPHGPVHIFASVDDAIGEWQSGHTDMILCDWNLPDGSGLDFVRHVRRQDPDVPIVMISGRSDRQSVLAAARHHVNAFITKPFDVSVVHDRLKALASEEDVKSAYSLDGPESLFADAMDGQVLLPTSLDPASVLELMHRDDPPSPGQLAERWRDETSLVMRLLDVANGSSYRRSGESVDSLRDAIDTLGVEMTLNIALGMAFDHAHDLSDARLQTRAQAYTELSDRVALEAGRLARQLNQDPALCYTAGLMGRVGELAVLSVLQQFLSSGGALADSDIDELIREWAQPLGNRLKVQWRLPLQLRDLVGAIHSLPHGSTHQSRLIMRAAALFADGDRKSAEYLALMRRLGMEPPVPDPAEG